MIAVLRSLDQDYRACRYRTKVEPAEIALVRSILRPGDVAIDVGAHKGGFTYWMRRAVGPSGRVIAVEPQPALAARLAPVARLRRWHNISMEPCALSSVSGEATLWVDPVPTPGATLESSLQAGKAPITVPVKTLDDLVPVGDAVRLVKCDAEGHERLRLHRPRDQGYGA